MNPNVIHTAHHPQTGGGFSDLINRVNARTKVSSAEANPVVFIDSQDVIAEADDLLYPNFKHISFLGGGAFDWTNRLSSIYSIPNAVAKLCSLCMRHNIDIIHANSFRAAWLSSIVSTLLDVSLVTHVHHFTYLNHPRICSFIFTQSNIVLHVSEYSRSRYRSNIQINKDLKHKLVRSPVNVENLKQKPKKPRIFKKRFGILANQVVTLIGRMAKNKGHTEFIHAANDVLDKEDNISFLIVGGGDQEYKDNLKQLTKDLNVTTDIIFVGYWENLRDVYSASDIIAVPSRNENLPKVIQEAFVYKTPVIAKDSGGIPELIIDNKTGILINEEDAGDQLGEEIKNILSSPKIQTKLKTNGFKKVKNEYAIEVIRDHLEKIYIETIESSE